MVHRRHQGLQSHRNLLATRGPIAGRQTCRAQKRAETLPRTHRDSGQSWVQNSNVLTPSPVLSPTDCPFPLPLLGPWLCLLSTLDSGLGAGHRGIVLTRVPLLSQWQLGIERVAQAKTPGGRRWGMREAAQFGQKDAHLRECDSETCVHSRVQYAWEGPAYERQRVGKGPVVGCLQAGLPGLWTCLGRLPHRSQALLSPAALGHKVQWGDFVISSQGSLKGLAPLPWIDDNPLGCPQIQMSVCVGDWWEMVTGGWPGAGLGRDLGKIVAPLNLSSQGLSPLLAGLGPRGGTCVFKGKQSRELVSPKGRIKSRVLPPALTGAQFGR